MVRQGTRAFPLPFLHSASTTQASLRLIMLAIPIRNTNPLMWFYLWLSLGSAISLGSFNYSPPLPECYGGTFERDRAPA